jgi:hypothetical protein
MHQFYDHIIQNKKCSCGKYLTDCLFWSNIINENNFYLSKELVELNEQNKKFEKHSSIISNIVGLGKGNEFQSYLENNEYVLEKISQNSKGVFLLDSSKYVGRFLCLNKSDKINVKAIYLIRDVRGVIVSFLKNVQSSRVPVSTIFYYTLVNLASTFVHKFTNKNNVLKVRYEDFMENSENTLTKIEAFLNIKMDCVKTKIKKNDEFKIGHIIGGNRLKTKNSISFNKDEKWKKILSRKKQIIYYLLTAPIMIINKYKI